MLDQLDLETGTFYYSGRYQLPSQMIVVSSPRPIICLHIPGVQAFQPRRNRATHSGMPDP